MENQHEKQKETDFRNPATDIVEGASNTDQLEAMHQNVPVDDDSEAKKNILEVDNGSLDPILIDLSNKDDLDNPLTRGI